MSLGVLVLLAATLANALLGLLILLKGPKELSSRIFGATAFSVAAWTLTNALFQATSSPQHALWWAALSYVAALCLCASFLHFTWLFPRRVSLHPLAPG